MSQSEKRRGVTPVLGLTLLIGIVAAASVGIFLMGTTSVESISQQAEHDRVESSFVQFSKEVATVSAASETTREIDLGTDRAVRKAETGRIEVTVASKDDPLVNESIGSIEYRDHGRVVAYQAGGVWRGTGNRTKMVSAPDIHYRHGSLTFPIMRVNGEETLSSDRIRIAQHESRSALGRISFVEGELVTVTINSEYYVGWAEFFETRTSDVAVTLDHANETTIVELGQPNINGNFEDAIVSQGDIEAASTGSPCVEGPIVSAGTYTIEDCDTGSNRTGGGDDINLRPIDTAINMTVDDARDTGEDITGAEIDNGTYFVDGDFVRTTDLTLDLSAGNVTMVVDGDIGLDDSAINVETGGSDNIARVYTTGDVAIGRGEGAVTVDTDEAERFQLYGTSQMHFAIGQGEFTGTVYAPRDEPADGSNTIADAIIQSSNNCNGWSPKPDVCIGQGNVDFTGSVIAGPTVVEQNAEVRYDTQLQDVEPTLALENVVLPPPLTHMRIVAYDIDVSNDT